jgi:hypothetical protein
MTTFHTKENNMAKAITPKEAANLLTRKRGRPAGVKNKPKALEKQIAHWDAEPRTTPVDFKELAQKLQNALAKSYVEIDLLRQKTQLDRQSIIIEYLESRVK